MYWNPDRDLALDEDIKFFTLIALLNQIILILKLVVAQVSHHIIELIRFKLQLLEEARKFEVVSQML